MSLDLPASTKWDWWTENKRFPRSNIRSNVEWFENIESWKENARGQAGFLAAKLLSSLATSTEWL
jgi:hypothetical protein